MPPPQELLQLSHDLGRPERDLAILAEGNTSCLTGETFWVKGSGHRLDRIEESGFVECRPEILLDAMDRDLGDAEVHDTLLACRVGEGPKPSVEAFMHAWLLTLPGVEWVGHVHPAAALSLLCQPESQKFCEMRFFPDEVVCCGRATAWVPYVDPGLLLARAVRRSVLDFVDKFSERPKIIWMQNHGTIAIGVSPNEVESAILMNDKVCRVINAAGALKGGLVGLSQENIDRIHGRPDEHYRQRLVWQTGGNAE